MRILHVTKKYLDILAGDSIVVASLKKQQVANGHTVAVITSNCEAIINDKTIYKFGLKDTASGLDNITPKRLLSLFMLVFKAFKVLRVERPDIIHTHSIDMAFAVSFAARFYRIPIVHTFHIVTFNDKQQVAIRRKSELLFLRGTKPHKIFLLNPLDIKDFERIGFPNVVFIPNGVNLEDWQIKARPKGKNMFRFITVGRLEQQKGLRFLIAAAAALHELGTNFEIQIIGEGSLRTQLEQQIKSQHLDKQVHLLGTRKQHQLRKLYTSADCFILPSLWEAFPIVLLEAWAAGLPAVVTKVGAVQYVAKGSALLVDHGDTKALATSMSKIMTDTSYRQSLVRKAAAAAKKYQWKNVNKAIEAEYGQAITSNRGSL